MIKARSGNTMILGLSKLNVERLQEGKPIVFDGSEIGLKNMRFIIMYGETEIAIIHELEEATNNGQANPVS